MKIKKIILSFLLIFFLTIPRIMIAQTHVWDFDVPSEYTLSNENIYFANSSSKLRANLTHISHTENGPSVLE